MEILILMIGYVQMVEIMLEDLLILECLESHIVIMEEKFYQVTETLQFQIFLLIKNQMPLILLDNLHKWSLTLGVLIGFISGNDSTLWLTKNNGSSFEAVYHFDDKVTSIEVMLE